MTTISLLAQTGPVCRDITRRADLLLHPTLNGIDFVEYKLRPLDPLPHVLVVTFLKPLPEPVNPDGAYGLTTAPELIVVDGGVRVVPIHVLAVARVGAQLEMRVDQAGDFSVYFLALGWKLLPDGNWQPVVPDLDPVFSIAPINFKAGCPADFDCRQEKVCPPEVLPKPSIDYLAKDYASFRQLLIDNLPVLNPNWRERNPSDLGIMLLELLAFQGDQLSYLQDAVANEAYLDTARQRVSARRHARLIDYRMHDGRNAWTFVHFNVTGTGVIAASSKLLTRVSTALRGQTAPPSRVIPEAILSPDSFEKDPALAKARVFETTAEARVDERSNTLHIHTWGNGECCLGRGTKTLDVYALGPVAAGVRPVILPPLAVGDFLLLEEVIGPLTGAAADADPSHRQVVKLTSVETAADPAYRDNTLPDGSLQVFQAGDTALPVLRLGWAREDALKFPLCLSSRPPAQPPLRDVSLARGNTIPADHGRTLTEVIAATDPLQIRLGHAPLTMSPPTPGGAVRDSLPAIKSLRIDFPSGPESWQVVPDLLDSPPFAQDFVAEADDQGFATLRFGDDEYGREPAGATLFTATYRIGNGRAGNIGAETLVHALRPVVAPAFPIINAVRNPLPASGGVVPETIEEVRQFAPAAFHAEQFRAVTEADYAKAAKKLSTVAGAVATFRWTGSWYTVFVGVDPRDPGDLITEPGGRTRLAPLLERQVRAFLTRFKLAGYDLEIRSAQYIPLELAMELCVLPDHFRGDVLHAVLNALSNHVNADGSKGFFHPDNFTFNQPVYLSRLYAAIEAVEGVDSVFFTTFQRFGKLPNGELESGTLPIGPWEIARLDNDPSLMENGVIRITAGGGK